MPLLDMESPPAPVAIDRIKKEGHLPAKLVDAGRDSRNRVRSELLLLTVSAQASLTLYESLRGTVVLEKKVMIGAYAILIAGVLILHGVCARLARRRMNVNEAPWITEFALQVVMALPAFMLCLSTIFGFSGMSMALAAVLANSVIVELFLMPIFDYGYTHVALRMCELGCLTTTIWCASRTTPDMSRRLSADSADTGGFQLKQGVDVDRTMVLTAVDDNESLATLLPYLLAPLVCSAIAYWRLHTWRRRLKEESKHPLKHMREHMREQASPLAKKPQEEDLHTQASTIVQPLQGSATSHPHSDESSALIDTICGCKENDDYADHERRTATKKRNQKEGGEEAMRFEAAGRNTAEAEAEDVDEVEKEERAEEEDEDKFQTQAAGAEREDEAEQGKEGRAEDGEEEDEESESWSEEDKEAQEQECAEEEKEEEEEQEEVDEEGEEEEEDLEGDEDEDGEEASSSGDFVFDIDGSGDTGTDWLEQELQNQYRAWVSDVNEREREKLDDQLDKEWKKEEYAHNIKYKRWETRQDLYGLYLLGQWNGGAKCRLPVLEPRTYLAIASFLCYSRSKTLGDFETGDAPAAKADDEDDDDCIDPEGYGTDESSGSLTRAWMAALDAPRLLMWS